MRLLRFTWRGSIISVELCLTKWSFYVAEGDGLHMSAFGPIYVAIVR